MLITLCTSRRPFSQNGYEGSGGQNIPLEISGVIAFENILPFHTFHDDSVKSPNSQLQISS